MNRKTLSLLCTFSLALFSLSCNKSLEDYFNPDGIADHIYRGPISKMGNGEVRSFFTIGPNGVPLKLGYEFSDAALSGLPTDPSDHMENSIALSIPQKAKDMTAFDHLTADWNPGGHPPFGVYDAPHFDFHFYKISLAKQMNIPPYSPETAALFDNLPPAGYIPANFIGDPGGVPGMGKHWTDKNAPELTGGTFTKTFIFGSYDGAVIFYEPMITHSYLSSGAQSSTAFEQPTYFAPDEKYYPTKYEVTVDARKKMHTVALTDFVWRGKTN